MTLTMIRGNTFLILFIFIVCFKLSICGRKRYPLCSLKFQSGEEQECYRSQNNTMTITCARGYIVITDVFYKNETRHCNDRRNKCEDCCDKHDQYIYINKTIATKVRTTCNYLTSCTIPPDVPDRSNISGSSDEPDYSYTINYSCILENVCDPGEFMCHDGHRCLASLTWQCDGDDDCMDNSDELNCQNKEQGEDICSDTEFKCIASRECIYNSLKCNGHQDCADNFDEQNCNYTCRDDQFKCENNHCISKKLVCDHSSDCVDGSDELNCHSKVKCDDMSEFDCYNDGSLCIPPHKVCDGINDCQHQEDESADICGTHPSTQSPTTLLQTTLISTFTTTTANKHTSKSLSEATTTILTNTKLLITPELTTKLTRSTITSLQPSVDSKKVSTPTSTTQPAIGPDDSSKQTAPNKFQTVALAAPVAIVFILAIGILALICIIRKRRQNNDGLAHILGEEENDSYANQILTQLTVTYQNKPKW